MAARRLGSIKGKVVGFRTLLVVCVLVALLFVYLGVAFAAEYTGETSTYLLMFGIAAAFMAGAIISGVILMKVRRAAK